MALYAVKANIIEMPVADEAVVFKALQETHRDLPCSPIPTDSLAFRSRLPRLRMRVIATFEIRPSVGLSALP